MQGNPVANIIYEGDDFEYRINTDTGLTSIVKHEQKFDNVDINKIKGAYAIVTMPDGERQVTIMSIAQIRSAWGQGATKGASPAHKNFTDEMAKKTAIGRACKMLINSSDDAYLFDGKRDEFDRPDAAEVREASKQQPKETVGEDVDFEEVVPENKPKEEQPKVMQEGKGELFNDEAPY